MVKILNKFLKYSNSYNFYKSRFKLLKIRLSECEHEKRNIKNEFNQLKISFHTLQETHNNQKKQFKNLENDIHANRILQNINSLKKEVQNGKQINIIFIINFAISTMDNLIDLLEKDPIFNSTVVVIPYDPHGLNIFDNGLNEDQLKEYNDNYLYFKNRGFNVIKGYNEEYRTLIDIDFDLRPDIIFYSSPWEDSIPQMFRIKNFSSDILFCYIPYGIYAAKMQEDQFNRELHNKAWKIFSETPKHKELATLYSSVGSSNVIVTGYPKMDPLIDGSHEKRPYPWKDSSHHKKRIIWAPHHSIGQSLIGFSTFDKNYKFFYDYAKKHAEIEWVFKPHPQLRYASVHQRNEDGDLNYKTMGEYFRLWRDLSNATVYEGGDYLNLFATSDAMITDSVSFLSEYLYVQKPGLFLTRSTQKFNEFGEIIREAWYQVDGTDLRKIADFIDEVVLNNQDPLKSLRDNIYRKYLSTNGVTASNKIYEYIKGNLIT